MTTPPTPTEIAREALALAEKARTQPQSLGYEFTLRSFAEKHIATLATALLEREAECERLRDALRGLIEAYEDMQAADHHEVNEKEEAMGSRMHRARAALRST